jgi:hypothetical protein
MEEVYATVLERFADVMASEIEENKVGVVSTVDEKYYLVKWTNLPYRVDGDRFLTEYDPPIHVKDGEQVTGMQGHISGGTPQSKRMVLPNQHQDSHLT